MSAIQGTAGAAGDTASQGSGGFRPLSAGETISTAISLYRQNAVQLWTIVAMIIVPIQIIDVIVRRVALPSDVTLRHGTFYTHQLTTASGGTTVALILVALLSVLGSLLATGAVLKLQIDAYLGHRHDSTSEAFSFAGHRLGSLLWLGIMLTVLIGIGFVLIIVPGLWLLIAASVSVPVLMVEGVKGFGAIKRSVGLVKGRWWATFGRLIVAFLLYAIVLIVIGAIVGGITHSMTNVTLFLVISAIGSALGAILVHPFTAAVANVIYVDLRVRKEGLDHATLAAATGAPTTAQVASTSGLQG